MSTEQFNEPGYLWNMTLPLRAIHESGIRLKTDEWAIFFAVKEAIDSDWSSKHIDDKKFAWVSAKHIKSQLRCLEDVGGITNNALYRKIKKLEDAGLLIRREDNSKESRCYLAKGPAVMMLTYSRPIEEMQGGVAKTQNPPLQKCNTPIAKMQPINTISNKENIEDNSLSPDVPPGASGKKPKAVEIKNCEQGRAWYENESLHVLKSPPPFQHKELIAAAAARPDITLEGAAGGYRKLCQWINGEGNDEYPNGMRYIQGRKNPLEFEGFCRLCICEGYTRVTIMENLLKWENAGKDWVGTNIFVTLMKWARDNKAKKRPMNMGGNTPQNVLSVPKKVEQ